MWQCSRALISRLLPVSLVTSSNVNLIKDEFMMQDEIPGEPTVVFGESRERARVYF